MRHKKLVALLLVFTFFLSFLTASFAAQPPRHKDPLQTKEEKISFFEIFSLYGTILELMSLEKWDSALGKLKETILAYMPDEIRYIFNRFDELLKEITQNLNDTKIHINSATTLINHTRMDDAKKELEEAQKLIVKAYRNTDELDASIIELERLYPVETLAKPVIDKLQKLRELIEKYRDTILELYERIKNWGIIRGPEGETIKLEPTFLTISSPDKDVVVSSEFRVYGELKIKEDIPLPDKFVTLFIEGKEASQALTQANGSFNFKTATPLIYKPELTVYASYFPQGPDANQYASSSSNVILLGLIYDVPLIEVRYKEPAYPTLPFLIEGKVTVNHSPLPEHNVHVTGLQSLAETLTDEKGEFMAQLIPSAQIPTGKATIKVLTPPKGRIAPSSRTLSIMVRRKTPQVMVDTPPLAFPQIPFILEGRVSVEDKPLSNAKVKVTVGNQTYPVSLADKGRFISRIKLPFLTASGWQRIALFIFPEQAWAYSASPSFRIFVVNPAVFLPFALLFVLFSSLNRKRKKELQREKELEKEAQKEKVLGPPKKPESKEKKALPPILRFYEEAIKIIARITHIAGSPTQTIREYLEKVKPLLKENYESFKTLSLITEKFLYALRVTKSEEKDEEKKAEEAFKRLKKL